MSNPADVVTVPREPTAEMLMAAGAAVHHATYWRTAYEAMIAAAPASEPGEAVAIYQSMCNDEDDLPGSSAKDLWMDTPKDSLDKFKDRPDIRWRVVYTAPKDSDAEASLRALLAELRRNGEEVREVGVTPDMATRDRDELIARYNAFPALTEQVASLVAEVGQARQTAEYWKAEQYKANAENATLRNGITSNGCEIVEAADCDAGGPWVRNVRAEAAEQQLAAMTADRDSHQRVAIDAGLKLAAMREDVARLEDAICASFMGALYLDPPDGGDVPLTEQLRRMGVDAARYRWLRTRTWNEANRFFLMSPPRTDEAIDAARAATKEPSHEQ